jgi:hypothetical protein
MENIIIKTINNILLMANSLIQLVAIGAANNNFPISMSTNSDILNTQSNIPCYISRVCDVMIIDGLIIPKIINLDDINTFDIIIGGSTIYSLPFDIIIATNNIEIKNNKYFIKFPHELFNINSSNQYLKNHLLFPLVSLVFNDVLINLKTKSNFDYQIITKHIYYQTELRNQIAMGDHTLDIYGYESFDITKKSFNIYSNFISTGLYVVTNSKLTDFKLYLNNNLSQNFTEDLIDFYSFSIYKKEQWTDKHSNELFSSLNKYLPNELIYIIDSYIEKNNKYMYFIPFNTLNNEIDGTINFSRIDAIRIDIKTEDNIYNGKIYNKHVNRLQIMHGTGSLQYV